MRYAIIESGGKQYKAVEGMTIEVDRLSEKEGAQVDLRTLLMADGEDFMIGTPTVSDILVKATVVDHFRGEKLFRFKYSPKKRIRVRGGHRQQYTRLMVDFIGKSGETRKVEKAEAEKKTEPKAEKAKVEPKVKAEKPAKAPAKEAAKKEEKKAPATSSPKGKKSTEKKPSTSKKSSK